MQDVHAFTVCVIVLHSISSKHGIPIALKRVATEEPVATRRIAQCVPIVDDGPRR